MHCSRVVLFFAAIMMAMEQPFVGGVKGVGCGWGGCEYFSQHACTTDATGGSGRYKFILSENCGIGGKRRLCCDPECDYQACGKICADLGMESHLPSEKPVVQCTLSVPGLTAWNYFCKQ